VSPSCRCEPLVEDADSIDEIGGGGIQPSRSQGFDDGGIEEVVDRVAVCLTMFGLGVGVRPLD
jgi:hypothetical protein